VSAADYPRLLGDIGGTNARFGWQAHAGATIDTILVLPCEEHASLEAAIRAYLARTGLGPPRACSIGIANPVIGDEIRMTNHHWSFSISELQSALRLSRLVVLNDFAALALSLPAIPEQHLHQIGGQAPAPFAARALLGPGTGLGVSGLLPAGVPGQWVPIQGEGGHVTLAAQTATEYRVIEAIRSRYGHVSAERVLSGGGLVDLYVALRDMQHQKFAEIRGEGPEDITRRALRDREPLAQQALDLFTGFLGSVAGDLALTLGARGGVYLGGGILPRWTDWLKHSSLRARFEDKGRFEKYLKPIPVWVICAPHSPALWGAAQALDQADHRQGECFATET
jgi:glucokinase